jgi:hypothetical protein
VAIQATIFGQREVEAKYTVGRCPFHLCHTNVFSRLSFRCLWQNRSALYFPYQQPRVLKLLQLCYTRGGIIPCELRIVCDDTEALDLLFAPSSPVVKLFCHMQFKSIVKEKQASPSSVVSGVLDRLAAACLHAARSADATEARITPICVRCSTPSGGRHAEM